MPRFFMLSITEARTCTEKKKVRWGLRENAAVPNGEITCE